MKISKISKIEAEKEIAEKTVKGQYQALFEEMKKTGDPLKVEELTRGQVASLYRAATAIGLKLRANYKEGYVILLP